MVGRAGTHVLNLCSRPWLPGEPPPIPRSSLDENRTVNANNEAVPGPGQEPSVDAQNVSANPEEAAKHAPAPPVAPSASDSRLPVVETEKEPEGSGSFGVPPSQNIVDELQGSGSLGTPIPQIAGVKSKGRAVSNTSVQSKESSPAPTARENSVEVPETPEAVRTGAAVVTQTSFPRRRKPS